MRSSRVAIFALGFAAGVLVLGIALWASGSLKTTVATAASVPAWKQPLVPLPLNLNELAAEAKKVPPPAVAPGLPVEGEAARSVPETRSIPETALPHLSMPIAGLDPGTLPDTFEDKRDGRRHEALDIMSPRGTPVRAVAEGNVAKLFTSKAGGLTVYQFDNSQTYCYYYAHLSRYAAGLQQGTLLRKGDVLGYVGSTGNASPDAPHLHFAIFRLNADKKWWEGTPINPLPLFR